MTLAKARTDAVHSLPAEPESTGDAVAEQALRIPALFVCHGDDGGPSFHPCRRVQEALRAAGIEYTKLIGGHGNPIPFLRRDARKELQAATGTRKLPTLKLTDGTIVTNSRAILTWIGQQPAVAPHELAGSPKSAGEAR